MIRLGGGVIVVRLAAGCVMPKIEPVERIAEPQHRRDAGL